MASISVCDVLFDSGELRTTKSCMTLKKMITPVIKLYESKIWLQSDSTLRFLYS